MGKNKNTNTNRRRDRDTDISIETGASAVQAFDLDTTALTIDAQVTPIEISKTAVKLQPSGMPDKIEFAQWGEGNNLPLEVLKEAYKNIGIAKNIEFNARMIYGEGVTMARRARSKGGRIEIQELLRSEATEVFDFIEGNNFERIRQELGNDLSLYSRGFVQIILNEKREAVSLRHLDCAYSRISIIDAQEGRSLWHGYSAKWGAGGQPDDLCISALLDPAAPLPDLLRRIGLAPNAQGVMQDSKERRFVIDVSLPTPARFYYPKPMWWSVFESGWHDFACAIPDFKKRVMSNGVSVKYIVSVNKSYYRRLEEKKGAVTQEDKNRVRREFEEELRKFLTDPKSEQGIIITQSESKPHEVESGVQSGEITITSISKPLKGGEYIEDSEEAGNLICYAMGVHPSLAGAAPGKNKNINGTEARELFIIKQSLCRPERAAILAPLYIAKALNKWNADIEFYIANTALTTLDQHTGAQRQIGNQKV